MVYEWEQFPLERALQTLGEALAVRGLRFDVAVVGGAALLLMGLGSRITKDVDVVALVEDDQLVAVSSLPAPLAQAAHDVAADLGLPAGWLNAGPASLVRLGLPDGFLARSRTIHYGGLTVRVAARQDQIYFKLYAAVDQGPASKHLADLQALEPSDKELLSAATWCRSHDPSPGFVQMLEATLKHLGVSDHA